MIKGFSLACRQIPFYCFGTDEKVSVHTSCYLKCVRFSHVVIGAYKSEVLSYFSSSVHTYRTFIHTLCRVRNSWVPSAKWQAKMGELARPKIFGWPSKWDSCKSKCSWIGKTDCALLGQHCMGYCMENTVSQLLSHTTV